VPPSPPLEDLREHTGQEYPELAGPRQVAVPGPRTPVVTIPQRVPWSQLGPEFAAVWGRADPDDPQPEGMEIIGPNGSGKTHLLATVLQDREHVRNTPAVLVATKPADSTLLKLGWPVTSDWADVRKLRQCVYWPRTKLLGDARKSYHERKIGDLLERLWVPNSNTIVAFDDIGYTEKLSRKVAELIEMYWRESRSQGITPVGMKQRPQGANRHMSSETWWTAAFVPKDQADKERFAELFGRKQDWMPVFDAMDPDRHEFLLRHTRTRQTYISWCDLPLRPPRDRRPQARTPREYLYGKQQEESPPSAQDPRRSVPAR
jgi:hypothetical protein